VSSNQPPSETTANTRSSQSAGPQKPAITPLQAVLELARRGRQEILPKLRAALDEHPEIWQHYGDLGGLTEQAWLEQISGPDLCMRESMRFRLEALKKDLAGPSPSPLESLLIQRAAVCWLQASHADFIEATTLGSQSIALAQLRLKRMESSQRRLLHAIKTLAMVHRLGADLHVEVRHTGAEPAAVDVIRDSMRSPACDHASGPVNRDERLGRLFDPTQGAVTEGVTA
jgi:hypothetical protein